MTPPQSSTNCAQAPPPADNDLISEGAVSDAFTHEHRDRLRY